MSLIRRFFTPASEMRRARDIYSQLVALARHPDWYRHGGVADNMDGRFEMVALMLSLLLLRLEQLEGQQRLSVQLTETFVEDMDGQLRQLGIGDLIVGKHIGKMMSALGGRLGALRSAYTGQGDATDTQLLALLERNVWHGEMPDEPQQQWMVAHCNGLRAALQNYDAGQINPDQIERLGAILDGGGA